MKYEHNDQIKILAIETSCDETSVAVIGVENGNPVILSNVVSSQIDLHAKTGGVVPEVASRAHMEAMIPVIKEALLRANSKFKIQNLKFNENSKLEIENSLKEITHVAVTAGPGLIGSLLVGFNTAKSLAYALDLPIIPVNHIEGHIYSALAEKFSIFNFQFSNKSHIQNSRSVTCNLSPATFPILALTVSGGHTSLTLVHNHGEYENIGQTLDDAAGEAFDKVAKLLGLGYPGGPEVSKIAKQYRNTKNGDDTIELPLPLSRDNSCNFSFSGLKTAVINVWRKAEEEYENQPEKIEEFKAELAAKFEETAIAHLIDKTLKALRATGAKNVVLAGGVSANNYLRENMQKELKGLGVALLMPPMELCGDNAAMIGLAAYYHIIRENVSNWHEIKIDSNFRL
ncbi:MAG: tRNA N6-adenosine threonylcarbamoyltransferase [bacterium ADurb.Bin212]|nr:MAG: tRNA N6-adenosine threonylcarbamoyltransferase [bacterium ADurb.Bin212]